MARKPRTPSLDRLVRTPAALERTKLSRRSLYSRAESGQLTVYKVGAATYWSLDELDALVTRRGAA